MSDPQLPGRKLELDDSVYCSLDYSFVGGKEDCDHDYDPKPSRVEDTYGEWVCTRCGGRFRVAVWS